MRLTIQCDLRSGRVLNNSSRWGGAPRWFITGTMDGKNGRLEGIEAQ